VLERQELRNINWHLSHSRKKHSLDLSQEEEVIL
jgi:hypothetical protein